MAGRRAVLCACIALNCLTCGAYLTFPIYGPVISRRLSLNMSQTNLVLLGAIVGQYLSALFYGSLADYSSRLSSLSAAILFSAGYSFMAIILARSSEPSYFVFVAGFFAIGSGTVGSYFAALTASAKSFPLHPGLAIGVPSALFGSSPVLLSAIGSALFTNKAGPEIGEIDAVRLFAFFAGLLGFVNLLSAVALVPLVPNLQDIKEIDLEDDDNESLPPTPTEEEPLLAASMLLQPHTDVQTFLKQYYVWIFLALVLLLNGPSEVISQNLGSIAEALAPIQPKLWPDNATLEARTRQIQIFSVVNTVTRLAFGAISDYTCPTRYAKISVDAASAKRRFTTPRLTYLQLSAGLLIFASLYSAFFLNSLDSLWVLSSCAGLSYGLINVVGPSLVSKVWGEQDFGRNFGLIWSFAAVGPIFFGMLYGQVSDYFAHSQATSTCKGRICFEFTFLVIAAGGLIALILISSLKRRKTWRRV